MLQFHFFDGEDLEELVGLDSARVFDVDGVALPVVPVEIVRPQPPVVLQFLLRLLDDAIQTHLDPPSLK